MADDRFDDYACLRDFESKIGFTPIEVIPYDAPPEGEVENDQPKSGFSVGK